MICGSDRLLEQSFLCWVGLAGRSTGLIPCEWRIWGLSRSHMAHRTDVKVWRSREVAIAGGDDLPKPDARCQMLCGRCFCLYDQSGSKL
ncbi:MAG: hypothetical protein HC895_05965 [Leptolyngbyaceae cyanobacterium SM1_3_5]|nr:hypothetical protein [Leptolyngbyaceae cyanobacterium SM1_3_5]